MSVRVTVRFQVAYGSVTMPPNSSKPISATPQVNLYGGRPMNVYVHRRRPGRVAAWLEAAGFTVEAEMLHRPEPDIEGGFVFAHR